MEIPDRIKQRLDGESLQSAVSLGDEDVICFTPSRTFLYRGEGLLSDEALTVYDHDIERLDVSEGRRKTTFTLEYVDSVEKFKITNKRAEQVLTRLLGGILETKGVLGEDESVAGVFLFSELTVVVTDSRMVKHVGSYLWDPDYEEFPFSDVTGLEFEDGSVATQIVLSVAGRPQRLKAPSDKAEKLRRTLSDVLFSYHDVQSLAELNEKVAPEADEGAEKDAQSAGLSLDESISPLVSDSADEDSSESPETESTDAPGVGDGTTMVAEATDDERSATDEGKEQTATTATKGAAGSNISIDEFEAMQAELSKLRAAVEKQQQQLDEQNEQIKKQRETIEQLIEELRRQL